MFYNVFVNVFGMWEYLISPLPPSLIQQVAKIVSPIIITPGHAVHLKARQAFTDGKGT